MPSITPFPLHTFGGLNLRDSVDSVGDQCIDALNVDLDRSGTKVRTRYGYAELGSTPFSSQPDFLFRQSGSSLLVSAAGEFYSYGTSGATTSLASHHATVAANFGTPSTTATYYTIDSSSTVRKLVGTTVSTPTATVDGAAALAMPKGGLLAVQDNDNRLVVQASDSTGGPNGVASSAHHVWFSEPGNAEAWKTANYVQLTPGDGEKIRDIVGWRGNLFVFKDSKLFVFYGNSTDASGNPIFNYRTVQLPSRIGSGQRANKVLPVITVGEDGVYFVANDGLYVTTGDMPVLLSEDLYPLGTDDPLPSTLTAFSARWSDVLKVWFHKRRVYVTLTGSTPATLIFDIDSGNWLPWSIAPTAFATWEGEDSGGLLYFTGQGSSKKLYRFKSSFTQDDGSNISSYYQTGFNDYGTDTEKVIRDAELWGTGTIAYSVASDFGSQGTAQNVALGSSPVAHGFVQKPASSKKGTLFSHRFASVSGGAWSLHRCVQNIESARNPGMKGGS